MSPVGEVETNIPYIAQQVFSIPPGPPCSIGLQLDTDVNDGRDEDQARTIFEILMTLTLKGMRVKYGENTDPRRLSEQQISTLQDYMKSFGWTFKIISSSEEENTNRDMYNPTQIEWYRLRLPDPEYKLNHDIVFSIFIPPIEQHSLY